MRGKKSYRVGQESLCESVTTTADKTNHGIVRKKALLTAAARGLVGVLVNNSHDVCCGGEGNRGSAIGPTTPRGVASPPLQDGDEFEAYNETAPVSTFSADVDTAPYS